MCETSKKRIIEYDLLKTSAIFAVILFHFGIQTYGYLGVDIFLVLNGYLVINSLLDGAENGKKETYFGFLFKKLLAFWPFILIAGTVSLIIGCFAMLPDSYENLAESVVASNVFANNILLCITTGDYWNALNIYKPLMQFWYIGLLMQSYLILPVIPLATKKSSNQRRLCAVLFAALTAISLVLYLNHEFPSEQKFYYLPFRFFELSLGAVIACLKPYLKSISYKPLFRGKAIALAGKIVAFAAILFFLISPVAAMSDTVRLLIVCLLSAVWIVLNFSNGAETSNAPRFLRAVAFFGKMSLDLYVWHQVILAFLRCTVADDTSFAFLLLYLSLTLAAGFLSYYFLEKPLSDCAKNHPRALFCVCLAAFVVTTGISYGIFRHKGVIRDVPELDITVKGEQKDRMTYNLDAGIYDVDFSADEKQKILVIGDSYGRDFVNVLLKSGESERSELSYIPISLPEDTIPEKLYGRISDADFVFLSFDETDVSCIVNKLSEYAEKDKIYVVGSKRYGKNTDLIFNRRNRTDYKMTVTSVSETLLDANQKNKELYGSHYIDMLAPVLDGNGAVYVFTDTQKLISFDTSHFTEAGAEYYAKILNLDMLDHGGK